MDPAEAWAALTAAVLSGSPEDIRNTVSHIAQAAGLCVPPAEQSPADELVHLSTTSGDADQLSFNQACASVASMSDSLGRTALHIACSRQSTPVQNIIQLLELGADPCTKDVRGNTPLHLCAITSHSQGAQVLAQAQAHYAQFENNERQLEQQGTDSLTEQNRSILPRDSAGNTALDWAKIRLRRMRASAARRETTAENDAFVSHVITQLREIVDAIAGLAAAVGLQETITGSVAEGRSKNSEVELIQERLAAANSLDDVDDISLLIESLVL